MGASVCHGAPSTHFQSIAINTMFTHSWGAVKYPDVPLFHTGPSPYLVPCGLCRHFCPPTAEEPLKYPFVRGPCYSHCMSAPFSTFPVNQYWQNCHLWLGSC